MTNPYAARDASYRNRLERGDRVRFLAPKRRALELADGTWTPAPVPAGAIGTVLSETNAGFRGIEAMVELEDGTWVVGVSTGILELLGGEPTLGASDKPPPQEYA